jgi:hypothetical protein
MPVKHIVLLKLKPGITHAQITSLYEAIMSLAKLSMVQSVSAGENFSQRSQGYNFGFELVLTDLHAYQNDPFHATIRDTVISPLVAEGGYLSVDYEFPRGIAVHGIGHEVATPELQRWGHVNEDILVEHDMISSKSDASIWRTAVAARPIRGHAYVDFTIERNPKPETRSIQIGVVPKSDLNGVEKPGVNFINFQKGIAWSSNGGFVTGNANAGEKSIPHHPWEHDHQVGILVDTDKGVLQFFFDRKKVGPVLHLKDLHLDGDLFFAVSIDTPKTAVKAHWTASAPKVFLG